MIYKILLHVCLLGLSKGGTNCSASVQRGTSQHHVGGWERPGGGHHGMFLSCAGDRGSGVEGGHQHGEFLQPRGQTALYMAKISGSGWEQKSFTFYILRLWGCLSFS